MYVEYNIRMRSFHAARLPDSFCCCSYFHKKNITIECTKDLLCVDGVGRVFVVVLLPPLSGGVSGRGFVDDGVLVDECSHGAEV